MQATNKTFTPVGPDGKPYPSTSPGSLGGHRGGRLYGRLDCRAALWAIVRGGYVSWIDAATSNATRVFAQRQQVSGLR